MAEREKPGQGSLYLPGKPYFQDCCCSPVSWGFLCLSSPLTPVSLFSSSSLFFPKGFKNHKTGCAQKCLCVGTGVGVGVGAGAGVGAGVGVGVGVGVGAGVGDAVAAPGPAQGGCFGGGLIQCLVPLA